MRTNGSSITAQKLPFVAFRAASSTSAPLASRHVDVIEIAGSSPLANGHRDPLGDSTVIVASRVLAIIDGEVATDEVGPHCCVFTSKGLGSANDVRLVLAIVNADDAGVPGCAGVRFVKGLWPVTAPTETYIDGYWTLN